MLPLPVFKTIGLLSAPVFYFAPNWYFRFYSAYKKRTDSAKIKLISQYIKPGDTILDIGAHIGFYSKLFSSFVGPNGKVLAFEPDPVNFERLKYITRGLNNVSCVQTAVGETNGTINLYRSKLLNVDHRAYISPGESRHSVEVDCLKLDDFLKDKIENLSFVKIDIQGYEMKAFIGMNETLKKYHPKIISELWPWGMRKAGDSAEKLINFFREIGYQTSLIDEETGKPAPFDVEKLVTNEQNYYDIICNALA